MAAPSILVPPRSMPIRNGADMARFPHAERLRIIKLDPLESIGAEPAVAGIICLFRGWEHDIGRFKTGGGRRANGTEEGIDRRGQRPQYEALQRSSRCSRLWYT